MNRQEVLDRIEEIENQIEPLNKVLNDYYLLLNQVTIEEILPLLSQHTWEAKRGSDTLYLKAEIRRYTSPIFEYFKWSHDSYLVDNVRIGADDGDLIISGHISDVAVFIRKYHLKVHMDYIEAAIEECQDHLMSLKQLLNTLGEGNVP